MENKIQVLEEPKVNNSINLSMTTSDLIDLYIEENSVRIKAEILDLIARVQKEELLDFNDVKKEFLKHFQKKLPFKPTTCNLHNDQKTDKKRIMLEFLNCRLDYIEGDYLNSGKSNHYPLRMHLVEKYLSVNKLSCITMSDSDTLSSITLDVKYLPESIVKKYDSKMLSIEEVELKLIRESQINSQIFNLYKEFKDLQNTRKVKAAFTKKALLQTKEGAKMVEFLKNIESIKSLN